MLKGDFRMRNCKCLIMEKANPSYNVGRENTYDKMQQIPLSLTSIAHFTRKPYTVNGKKINVSRETLERK